LPDDGATVACCEAVGLMSQCSAGGSRVFRLAQHLTELVEFAAPACHGYRGWQDRAGPMLVDGEDGRSQLHQRGHN
jgi:hypothetical protein